MVLLKMMSWSVQNANKIKLKYAKIYINIFLVQKSGMIKRDKTSKIGWITSMHKMASNAHKRMIK